MPAWAQESDPVAKHEALAPPLPPLETRLIILGEFLERIAHLLVGQKLPQASTAFDLFLKISMFIFHGVTVYAFYATAPTLDPANDAVRARVPSGASA
jgi:hypothetical protein